MSLTSVLQLLKDATSDPFRLKPVEDFIAAAGLPPTRTYNKGRPRYEPEKWNDAALVTQVNCYGYARDKEAWLRPGYDGGYKPGRTTSLVFDSAVRDGLLPAPLETPPDLEGYYLTALVGQQHDIYWHWYRKDEKGLWSHKPGQAPVTNRDECGRLIYDPKTCDRGDYNEFISYFYVPC